MSISIERTRDTTPPRHGAPSAPGAIWPDVGQRVPEDPGIRAIKGVLWSVTLARVVLLPVFLIGALRFEELVAQGPGPGRLRWGLVLTMVVIAGSDALDGWLARRYGLATRAGAVVDAVADGLVQLALVTFFTFAAVPAFASLPIWFFALVVARDLLVGSTWLVLRARGVAPEVSHRIHGRAATAGVFLVLIWLTVGLESEAFTALLLFTSALIWVSIAANAADLWRPAPDRRGEEEHREHAA